MSNALDRLPEPYHGLVRTIAAVHPNSGGENRRAEAELRVRTAASIKTATWALFWATVGLVVVTIGLVTVTIVMAQGSEADRPSARIGRAAHQTGPSSSTQW